jgi:hypothetical protein
MVEILKKKKSVFTSGLGTGAGKQLLKAGAERSRWRLGTGRLPQEVCRK